MKRKVLYSVILLAMAFVFATGCDKDDDSNGDDNNSNPSPKQEAVQDYEDNYLGSQVDDPGWTGSVNGCNAGDVSETTYEKVIQRINYFRRVCGLSDDVSHNESQNSMCQEAALMMKANNSLSHHPPQSWNCWTQDGYDAAGASNIALSSQPGSMHSTIAVTGYIEDPGANNKSVGHRAALLLPGLEKVGLGDTDQSNAILWMMGNYDQSAQSDPFVAYPPDDYIPGELMFPRWSFSITGANFDNADVSVSSDGNNYNVSYEARETMTSGWPDSRIVWKVNGLNYPITKDMNFDVTVSGIQNADKSSYSYTVKVFATDAAKKIAKEGKKHDYIIK